MGCAQSKQGRMTVTSSSGKPDSNKPIGQPITREEYYNRHGVPRKPAPKPVEEPAPQRKPEGRAALCIISVECVIVFP